MSFSAIRPPPPLRYHTLTSIGQSFVFLVIPCFCGTLSLRSIQILSPWHLVAETVVLLNFYFLLFPNNINSWFLCPKENHFYHQPCHLPIQPKGEGGDEVHCLLTGDQNMYYFLTGDQNMYCLLIADPNTYCLLTGDQNMYCLLTVDPNIYCLLTGDPQIMSTDR